MAFKIETYKTFGRFVCRDETKLHALMRALISKLQFLLAKTFFFWKNRPQIFFASRSGAIRRNHARCCKRLLIDWDVDFLVVRLKRQSSSNASALGEPITRLAAATSLRHRVNTDKAPVVATLKLYRSDAVTIENCKAIIELVVDSKSFQQRRMGRTGTLPNLTPDHAVRPMPASFARRI